MRYAHDTMGPRPRRRPQPRGVRLDHLLVCLLILVIGGACVALWRGAVQVEFSEPTAQPQPTARIIVAPAPPRAVVAPAAPVVVEQPAPVEAAPIVKGTLGGKANTLPAPPPVVEPAPVAVGVGELGGRVNDLPAPPPVEEAVKVQSVVEPVKGELESKPIEPTPAKGTLGGRAKP